MFRQTVNRSSGLQPLKKLANPRPLDRESVREAVRVARKRVVLKERLMSGEFERLGFQVVKEASNMPSASRTLTEKIAGDHRANCRREDRN